jgi:hypothetical protein
MKKIICEMCGSADLIKEEGLFVCQSCGVKYSIEEAKKLMIEGTVQIEGTVKIDNSATVQNFLDIAKNSLAGGNGKEAFEYANKALEVMSNNVDAWLLKMQSIQYADTIGDPRLSEVISSGKNAIQYAAPDQKSKIEFKVYNYYLERSLDLLKLATFKLNETDQIKNTYDSLVLGSGNASNTCYQADLEFWKLFDGLANEAIALSKNVPDNNVKDSKKLQWYIYEIARQYQHETWALEKRLNIYNADLADTARHAREVETDEIKRKILSDDEFRIRIEAKKVKMEKEFAEQKKDEYAVIQNKKDSIKPHENRIAALQSEVASLINQNSELKNQKSRYVDEDRINKDIIRKNQNKLFGKEKAKTACDDAQRKINANALKILDIEDQIINMNDNLLPKEREVQKINSEIGPIRKDIAELCENIIFQGVGE